jgi:hypothetical protein
VALPHDDWPRLKEVFAGAAGGTTPGVPAEACRDNEALRQESRIAAGVERACQELPRDNCCGSGPGRLRSKESRGPADWPVEVARTLTSRVASQQPGRRMRCSVGACGTFSLWGRSLGCAQRGWFPESTLYLVVR